MQMQCGGPRQLLQHQTGAGRNAAAGRSSPHHSICLSATPVYVQYAHVIHVHVQYLFAAHTGLAIFLFSQVFYIFLLLLEHCGITKQILFYYNVFITQSEKVYEKHHKS